jgi:hypothetical protein
MVGPGVNYDKENTMITIKFGEGNQVQRPTSEFRTVGAFIGDAALKRYFGYGDNVEVYLVGNGVVPNTTATVDGAAYSIVTKANSKG